MMRRLTVGKPPTKEAADLRKSLKPSFSLLYVNE
jgi:hypothetical protein